MVTWGVLDFSRSSFAPKRCRCLSVCARRGLGWQDWHKRAICSNIYGAWCWLWRSRSRRHIGLVPKDKSAGQPMRYPFCVTWDVSEVKAVEVTRHLHEEGSVGDRLYIRGNEVMIFVSQIHEVWAEPMEYIFDYVERRVWCTMLYENLQATI